ncbi:MAG TPA: hypothetical protein VGJ48_22970 [Pyrinomonadaceae bacterium]|jgi:hypothetical protein
MTSVEYEGYEIRAVPHQLAESGESTVDIFIVKDTGDRGKA